jgi:co-chaperonin GroES (HSP10)
MGPCACSEEDIWGPPEYRPKQGDKVIFSKHAGAIVKKLGKEYKLIQDKDLGAVMEESHE